MFQSYALFPNLSVAANVGYGLVNRAQGARRDRHARRRAAALVGLPEQGAKYPVQLSGGQQQRVALARALATSPGLLLLDEPLSALDARVRLRLRDEIKALQRRLGVTTIMVTHDQEEALAMADRIVVMNQGVIEQVGTPQDIYRKPATAFVADFVGTMNFLDAEVAGPSQLRFGTIELACPEPRRLPARRSASRSACGPEEVARRNIEQYDAEHDRHASRELLDFLGSFCRAHLAARRGAERRDPAPTSRSTRCAISPSRKARRSPSRCRRNCCACSRARSRARSHPDTRDARASRRHLARRMADARRHRAAGRLAAADRSRCRSGRCCRRASRTRTASSSALPTTSRYFSTPTLFGSIINSVGVAIVTDR